MNVENWKNKLMEYSGNYYSNILQVPLLNKDIRNAAILNANLLCSNIFVFKKPLDMEPCYIPYYMEELQWNESMNGDQEWIFMLNRHEYLFDLALAYVEFEDEKYINCWKHLVFNWIENNPFETSKKHTSWRTIDTGIRCASWVKSLPFIYQHLQDQELKKVGCSLQEQINYLRDQYIEKYTLSNWGLLQISGILQVAMTFEELVSKETVTWAWEELQRHCELQFYLDGVHWEQSPLYHFEVLFALYDLYMIANCVEERIPFDVKKVIEKGAHAAFYMMYPNGYLVPQHDSDYTYMEEVFEKLLVFNQTKMPEVFHGIESGHLVYKTENDYVSLWNGRHGSGHGHASLGHLNVFLKGERVLCDSGRFTYEEVPLRTYLKSAQAHSTVMVDNIPLTSIKDSWSYHYVGKDLGNRMKETDRYVVMESTFSHPTYTVQRTVIVMKEEHIVIVIDSVDSIGSHTMKRTFQLNPDMLAEQKEDAWFLQGKKNHYYAYFDHIQKTYSRKTISSSLYNQLTDRVMLIEDKQFNDRGVSVTVFSPTSLLITKNQIVQCGQVEGPVEELFLSYHIKSNHHNYDLYFAANDTFKGAKLYKHNKDYFYHKLTISQDGNKEIIF